MWSANPHKGRFTVRFLSFFEIYSSPFSFLLFSHNFLFSHRDAILQGMKPFLVATVDKEFKKIGKKTPHPPRRFIKGEGGERKEGDRVDVSGFLTQSLLGNIGHRDSNVRRFVLLNFLFYFLFFFIFLFIFYFLFFFLIQPSNRESIQQLEDLLLQHRKHVSLSFLPPFLSHSRPYPFSPPRSSLKDFLLSFLLSKSVWLTQIKLLLLLLCMFWGLSLLVLALLWKRLLNLVSFFYVVMCYYLLFSFSLFLISKFSSQSFPLFLLASTTKKKLLSLPPWSASLLGLKKPMFPSMSSSPFCQVC